MLYSRRPPGTLVASSGLVAVDRSHNGRSCALNSTERFGQGVGVAVAVVELNVVACRSRSMEADCLPDHERDRFRFEIARITRAWTVIAVVEHFVREFVSQHHEL